jgi:lysophospholipase L1-like esterase
MAKYLSLVILFFILSSFSSPKTKILIIGDSISIGYTPFVAEALQDEAIVIHNPGNAQHSGNGIEKLEEWLGDENWDIIQFNWGLWDLCYRHPDSKVQGNRDKTNGTITLSIEEYEKNLTEIVSRLKQTKAKLIFVTTSYIPENEAGRFAGDDIKYNTVAKNIMIKEGVLINDIYATSKQIHKKYGKGNDDVHYTEEGYKLLANPIVKFIQKETK